MTSNHRIPSATSLGMQGFAINEFALSLVSWLKIEGQDVAVFHDATGSSDLVGGRRPLKGDITKETYTFPIEIDLATSEVVSSLRLIVLGAVDEDLDSQLTTLVSGANKNAKRVNRAEKSVVRNKWGMVAITESSVALLDQIGKFAVQPNPVLILGETGTGKERVASALHIASGRKGKFTAINCGALSETLLEDELFGHVRGAFTGANANKVGAFEAATGGTIFLDEIGEMSERVQIALLRVLQENKVRRVGESVERPVDVRMVFATHRDLPAMVAERTFRSDLYFRVKRLVLNIVPLRERSEEILPMAEYFLAQFSHRAGRKLYLSPDARVSLAAHKWPGNVRELVNIMEDAAAVCEGGVVTALDLESLGISFLVESRDVAESDEQGLDLSLLDRVKIPGSLNVKTYGDFNRYVEEIEREFLAGVLQSNDGNKAKAAVQLGIPVQTFKDRVRKLGISKAVVIAA